MKTNFIRKSCSFVNYKRKKKENSFIRLLSNIDQSMNIPHYHTMPKIFLHIHQLYILKFHQQTLLYRKKVGYLYIALNEENISNKKDGKLYQNF